MLIGRELTVLGGGIGGLATAIALAMRGAHVRVLEQAAAITEVGAGMQISPNGMAVLRGLGLDDAVRARAHRATGVRLRDFRRGAEVAHLSLARGDRPYHFVHRADFVGILHDAARAAGVKITLDARVTEVAQAPDGAALTLADGRTETVPLLIAADGLHSVVRKVINPKSRPFFTGQVAWRCIIPSDTPLPPEVDVFMGPGRHLVRYPLRDGTLINIVAVEERDAWAAEGWHHRDDPENLRRAFIDFCPELRTLLSRADDVFLWGLCRHPVADHWHDDHMALIGDAAHPTLPFLAQGANMALEDAWVLADCLSHEDQPAALQRYQSHRRLRCMRIVDAAADNAQNYHLHPGPYRLAAHTALRAASRFAPHILTSRFDWLYGHDVTRG